MPDKKGDLKIYFQKVLDSHRGDTVFQQIREFVQTSQEELPDQETTIEGAVEESVNTANTPVNSNDNQRPIAARRGLLSFFFRTARSRTQDDTPTENPNNNSNNTPRTTHR